MGNDTMMRIVLADDHRMVREGIRKLVESRGDIEIVGEAEDGFAAVELAEKLKPDAMVMDLSMPKLNGIGAMRRIAESQPNMRFIVLSMHADRRFVAEALKAGAAGYLLKANAFEELLRAIASVRAGRVYLSPEISDIVVRDFTVRSAERDCSAFSVLTAREREVLQLIAEGEAMKEIAQRLGLSVKTVETHRQRIMDKLEIHSVAELTKYAIREGITSL